MRILHNALLEECQEFRKTRPLMGICPIEQESCLPFVLFPGQLLIADAVGFLREIRAEDAIAASRAITDERAPRAILAIEREGFARLIEDDDDGSLILGGEVSGRIEDLPSVRELMERIAREAEKIIKRLPKEVIA